MRILHLDTGKEMRGGQWQAFRLMERLEAAGVALEFDLTSHAVIGLGGLLKKLPMFRRLLRRLVDLAAERQPEVIILVDYGGFNLRLARAIDPKVSGDVVVVQEPLWLIEEARRQNRSPPGFKTRLTSRRPCSVCGPR